MKLNKSLPNAIYREGHKLGYNRSFGTLAKARTFVKYEIKRYHNRALTQIRRVGKSYAVYSTWY